MLRLKVALLAAASLLALTSCGIYQVVTIDSPEFRAPFEFINPVQEIGSIAADAFLGFELYYKLLLPGSDTGNYTGLLTREDLISRGFLRIAAPPTRDTFNGRIDRPLIKVPPADRGVPFAVAVSFNQTNNPPGLEPQAVPSATDTSGAALPVAIAAVTLHRGVPDNRVGAPSGQFKPFIYYDPGDTDINFTPPIWGSTYVSEFSNQMQMNILIYALSFGKDATFTDVYSIATYLGEMVIYFPYKS